MSLENLKAIENTPLRFTANKPDSKNGPLWRYMDLARFIDLLISKSLFFVRQEVLVKMDPLEGTYTQGNYKLLETAPITIHGEGDLEKTKEIIKGSFSKRIQFERRLLCICSMHQNNSESDAMWKIYGRDNKGIAIRFSIEGLLEAIDTEYQDKVALSSIDYVNYFSYTPDYPVINH